MRTKGLLVLALPVLALLAMGIANLILVEQLDDLIASTSATSTSIGAINQSLVIVLDAETGIRGYAATSNRFYLAPYNHAVKVLTHLDAPGHTIDGLTTAQSDELRALGTTEFVTLGRIENGVAGGTLHGAALDAQLLSANATDVKIQAEIASAQADQRANLAHQRSK